MEKCGQVLGVSGADGEGSHNMATNTPDGTMVPIGAGAAAPAAGAAHSFLPGTEVYDRSLGLRIGPPASAKTAPLTTCHMPAAVTGYCSASSAQLTPPAA